MQVKECRSEPGNVTGWLDGQPVRGPLQKWRAHRGGKGYACSIHRARLEPAAVVGIQHRLYHGAPGIGQIRQMAATAARPQETAVAMGFGQRAQASRCVTMCHAAVSHVCDGAARNAVRPALQQDELGTGALDKGFHLVPGGEEQTIIRTGGIGMWSLVPLATPCPVSLAAPVPG